MNDNPVRVFPVQPGSGLIGAVEVYQDGPYLYWCRHVGPAFDGTQRNWLPVAALKAVTQAEAWIAEQVKDCPHRDTHVEGRESETGSGWWETETCWDCEQTIRVGHM